MAGGVARQGHLKKGETRTGKRQWGKKAPVQKGCGGWGEIQKPHTNEKLKNGRELHYGHREESLRGKSGWVKKFSVRWKGHQERRIKRGRGTKVGITKIWGGRTMPS